MSDTTYGKQSRRLGERKWADVAVPTVPHEDRMSLEDAQDLWSEIYGLFNATSEAAQNEVKLAVYAYYAVNGASKETKHTHSVTTGGGVSVLAGDIVNLIGKERVRKFCRADVDEAYSALKESGVLESDEILVAKMQAKGVPRGFMHCTADYLRGCTLFTPEEQSHYDQHFLYSIRRARAARGGATLEQIGKAETNESLDAQREVGAIRRDEF